jgi:hypothetical protein
VWRVWGLTLEEEEELLATCTEIDVSEITLEEEDQLLCTCISEDLLRSGPSNRMCQVEDVGQLRTSLPTLRVRNDLFEEVVYTQSQETPSLIDIMIVEEEDEVQIIEPEIIYLKTVINIDIAKE